MRSTLQTPIGAIWVVLMAATALSWWLSNHDGRSATTSATVVVLAVAFAKAHLIGRWFMELRDAPMPLRLAFDGWVFAVAGALIALYLMA